jgi:4-amino-4-deoxy-L-arabinose transferase-like glycosyltransferase
MSSIKTSGKYGFALFMGLYAAFLVAVVLLLPRGVFWSGDEGVKYVQIQELSSQGQGIGLPYPGKRLIEDDRFFPLATLAFHRNGEWESVFPIPYALVNVPFYELFGYVGVFLLPVLSVLAAVFMVWLLCRSTLGSSSTWIAVLATALASPLVFYAFVVWEHALAAFLAVAGVYFLWWGTSRSKPIGLAVAGLLMALSVWVRTELYMIIPASGIALLLVDSPVKWMRRLVGYGIGVAIGLAPLWLLNIAAYGNPLGLHVLANLVSDATRDILTDEQSVPYLDLRWLILRDDLFPVFSKRWIGLTALSIVAPLTVRFSPRRRRDVWFVLSFGLCTVAGAAVLADYLRHGWRLTTLVEATPLIVLVPWLLIGRSWNRPAEDDRREHPDQGLRLVALVAGLYIVLVLVFSLSYGGQEWGGRLFLPAVPLLMILVGYSHQRLQEVGQTVRIPALRPLVSGSFGLLLLLGIGVQAYGIRTIWRDKTDYRRIAESLRDTEVIVSNVWWVPSILAPEYSQHLFFRARSQSDLCAFAGELAETPVESFSYLSAPAESPYLSLQDCGTTTVFTVEATTKLPAWTEFLEVHYARDAAR